MNGKLAIESSVAIGSSIYVGLGNAASDGEVWQWNGSSWSQIGGDGTGWAVNTYEEIYSMTTDGTNLYIGAGSTAGDGDVLRWNGSSWAQIGGDGSGWAASTYEYVTSLYRDGTGIYAGLGTSTNDAEVWRWNGSSWTKIGGDGVNSSFNTNYEYVASITGDGSNIYAGLASGADDAEVWRFNGSTWARIGGDGSGWAASTFEIVTSMYYQGGNLYAGLGNSAAGDGDLWRYNGTTWHQIGGDGSGWAASTYEQVWTVTGDGTNIYAGIGNTAGDNEVWRWDGSTWTQIGGDALNSGFTNTHTQVRALTYVSTGTFLYAGLQGTGTSAEEWRFNGSTWTRIGGNYLNGSWGYTNLGSVESMVPANGYLYAGTGNATAGNALIWQYDGTAWNLVGGQGNNSSWAFNTFESVPSLMRYGGNLYAGLGTSAGDGEVWRYSSGSWSFVGGDGTGWAASTYEGVYSMAEYRGNLYAGLGASANDAEIWRYNGSSWAKIAGDSTGWTTNYETVRSLAVYKGNLYAGLGDSAGDAEVWRYNGSTWARIGGDGTGWANSTFETVDSMAVYNGNLVAGLGTTAGDAEVWQYNGTTWSQIGGDALNSSWTNATYERVRALGIFNGELYAGLGSTAGDGEVWKWNGSTWSQIGGDSLNSGWASAHEHVTSFAAYKGKLNAGLGDSANTDAAIYAYGGNAILQSATASQNTNWHHIAATYDGATMKIYIDGTLDNSASATLSMLDTSSLLSIGNGAGSVHAGSPGTYLSGQIDEVRISDSARTSFTTTPYSSAAQTVRPNSAVFTTQIKNWDGFAATDTLNGGTINYRVSTDGGTTWQYYTGGAWTTSSNTSQVNTEAEINSNISTLSVGTGGILWQAVLDGDGSQQVTLNTAQVQATSDAIAPSNPSSLTSLSASGGSAITTDTWYTHTAPYFSWSGASDGTGSGISGYYVYFGASSSADPAVSGSFQAGTTYTASGLSSGSTYYLRIKAKDSAGNTAATTWAPFNYKFDNGTPSNPSSITVSPAGYAASNEFTFSWPAGSDSGSGLAGYQYKTATASGALADWSSTTSSTSVTITNAAYQADANVFYLRAVDTAGNVASSNVSVNFYYAGDGPSAPQFLSVSPSTSTSNSFAFSWSAPSSYTGSASELTYCYTVNTLPSASTCTFTSAGATSLSASSFATQVGLNTFNLVAKNSASAGSAINYGAYASVSFTANTSAPGIPLNVEISDASIKSSEEWKLTISWASPTDVGSGVANYQLYRSTDNSSFTKIATTTGSAYVDTSLEEETYYYKVRACDSVNNCGTFSSVVDLLPTGRFTSAATLASGPTVSSVNTKKATITWSTDRESDSKVQYGTTSGSYFTEEPSNSTQVTDHKINLTNLTPGTKYYYKAKWTDEDGNTGSSEEKTFTTDAAPFISNVKTTNISINSAYVSFTIKSASKVVVQYGKSTSYGGTETISTSKSESEQNVPLADLDEGTEYHFRIVAEDDEGNSYAGDDYTFETLPVPKIENLKVQQVIGFPTATLRLVWKSNTPVSSIVTYTPVGFAERAKDQISLSLVQNHDIVLRNLTDETAYQIVVRGKDAAGNEAKSDPLTITTASDLRSPVMQNVSVESTISGVGNNARAQINITWDTDEPGTTQVEYGEGTGTTYGSSTKEDAILTSNHAVTIPGLLPSKIYHLRVVSKDKAKNIGYSEDIVIITPNATRDALNLVVEKLSTTFGFLKNTNFFQ